MRKMLCGCFVALLAAGCATAKPLPKPFEKVVAQTDKLEERNQSLTGLDAVVFVTLRNDNAEPVTVSSAHYQVMMNHDVKHEGEVPLSVTIPPRSSQTVEVAAPMTYAASSEEAGKTERNIEYAVRGTLAVGGGTVEFARASIIRAPRLPTLTLNTLEAINGKASGLTVNASVEVQNPNPFPLQIKGLNWKMTVAGQDFGSGTVARKVTLKAASTTSYELSSNKDPGELKKLNLKLSGAVPYVVQGSLDVSGPPIALEAKGETRVLRDE